VRDSGGEGSRKSDVFSLPSSRYLLLAATLFPLLVCSVFHSRAQVSTKSSCFASYEIISKLQYLETRATSALTIYFVTEDLTVSFSLVY